MELRIYIRHTQFRAFQDDTTNGLVAGDPIIYTGLNTATLKPIQEEVPLKTWVDVTDSVADIDKLSLTYTSERDDNGNLTSDKINNKKTASGTLQFEGEAYAIIKEWLVDHIASPLNAIDVKIEDVSCGEYRDLVIKPSQLEWCEDGECSYDVTLQQKDESYHCIQKTIIDDNWQGWFHRDTTKKHPRFLYCNEGRPIAWLVALWYISTIIFIALFLLSPILNLIMLFMKLVTTVVNLLIGFMNALTWLVGGQKMEKLPKADWSNWFEPNKVMKTFYTESSGCGFNHPAPLIKDFIRNVCDKCGVKVDPISAPIFFASKISIDTSSEREIGVKKRFNPYFNACYMPPATNRGFRRYISLFGKTLAPVKYWNENNDSGLSLTQFLDEIKGVFNAEWRLQTDAAGDPTLYFWRKDWYSTGKLLYDFTSETDRLKILKGMCFNWNEKTMPAYISGLYKSDGSDSAGNQAKAFMNDKVAIGSKINNSLFGGEMDKMQDIGATKFRFDGVDTDYLMEASHMIDSLGPLGAGFPALINNLSIKKVLKQFDYALLLSDDYTNLGKIIIWDPQSGYDNAFAINNIGASVLPGYNVSNEIKPMPQPNPHYNPDNIPFNKEFEIKTNNSLFGSPLNGMTYAIEGWTAQARLLNYPMYFSSKYSNNLYDWFHWIDDPNVKPSMNMSWSCKIELCCEDLQKIGIFDGGDRVKLLDRIKVPNAYYNDGILTEITVSYDSEDEYGKFIELKGIV